VNNRASLRNFRPDRTIEPSRIARLPYSHRNINIPRLTYPPPLSLVTRISNTSARWSSSSPAAPMATARRNHSYEKRQRVRPCTWAKRTYHQFKPSVRLRLYVNSRRCMLRAVYLVIGSTLSSNRSVFQLRPSWSAGPPCTRRHRVYARCEVMER
jgi:hypothetical protein